jgi:hypothetical protein
MLCYFVNYKFAIYFICVLIHLQYFFLLQYIKEIFLINIFYAINPKFKRDFDYNMLHKNLITRDENTTKIVLTMKFTKNQKGILIINFLKTT